MHPALALGFPAGITTARTVGEQGVEGGCKRRGRRKRGRSAGRLNEERRPATMRRPCNWCRGGASYRAWRIIYRTDRLQLLSIHTVSKPALKSPFRHPAHHRARTRIQRLRQRYMQLVQRELDGCSVQTAGCQELYQFIAPPLFFSSSSTFIHIFNDVSSSSVTSLRRTRLIRRRTPAAVIQAEMVSTITTIKLIACSSIAPKPTFRCLRRGRPQGNRS